MFKSVNFICEFQNVVRKKKPEINDFAGDFHVKAGEPVKQWKIRY